MEFLEYSEDTSMSGSKFVWECKTITEDAKTTAGWLDTVTALQIIDKNKALNMSGKKILEGLLHQRAKVVVKIADKTEDIQKEWDVYQGLTKAKVPGILKYFCYFTCADSLKNYMIDQPQLCNGPGDSMKVLVMEYVRNPSFKNFQWGTVDVQVFISCVKQVVLTMLIGYRKCQFIHGDLHMDNVLMQPTAIKELHYEGLPTVPVFGFRVRLMDLELSKINTNASAKDLFKDVKVFVNKMLNLVDFFKLSRIEEMNTMLYKWINDNEQDPDKLLDLLPKCDAITAKGLYVGRGVGFNERRKRNRKPDFQKRSR